MLGDESILNTKKYQFPINQIQKFDFLQEIQKPISFSLEEIKLDMYKYAKEFDKDCIPHINFQNEVVDKIHNYPKPPKTKNKSVEHFDQFENKETKSGAFDHGRPNLKEKNINKALKELQHERTARLIGLIAHLAYWNVFGQFNKLQLDMYHRKQLFISIA